MTQSQVKLPTLKDVEDYNLLKDMLDSQKAEYDILAKKSVKEQLNPLKIKMANRVLEPLKALFKNEKSYQFLDILVESDMPTNSDLVVTISQYNAAIIDFKKRYYTRDKYQSKGYNAVQRWMTMEYPPDYYMPDPDEDDEEDDEIEE